MSPLPVPDPPLAAASVALRPWRAADLPALHAAFGDPDVQRFSWASVEPYTEDAAREYLAGQSRATGLEWALADPADGRLLGGASLYDVDGYDVDGVRATGSIGYWLAAPARGRGIATTAVRLIIGWAFGELGLARIELTCAPDNVASQRVASRAGFAREGLLRSHLPFRGGRRDTVLFSLLPPDVGPVMTVDGERFDVRPRAGRPGQYDLVWLTGPNDGYGFSMASSDPRPIGRAHLESAIRNFLVQVDPDTGYLD